MTESLTFALIGTVDSGKSTCAGRILWDYGAVDDHTVSTIKKNCEKKMSSWYLARLLDVTEEERKRGKTMEFAEMNFKVGDKMLTLRDTPGHDIYVKNLVPALHNIDCVLLVISMVENEFLKSLENLNEKLELLNLNQIKTVIVVASKMDVIGWSQKIFKKNWKFLKSLLLDRVPGLSTLRYVPVNSMTGDGLTSIDKCPDWYKGESVVDYLCQCNVKPKKIDSVQKSELKGTLKVSSLFNGIITRGMFCIAHCGESTTDCTILKMKKRFLKSGEECLVVLKLATPQPGGNVILRLHDKTIGTFDDAS